MRKALFESATVLLAALTLSGCDDTRRDWDVCHSEPCKEGFFCNAQQRCEPIKPTVDASAEAGRADGGDAAADGDADADAPADAAEDAVVDGADEDATPDVASTADGSSE